MAALLITLLLLCCSVSVSTECDYNVAVGKDLVVPLDGTLKDSEKVKWMHKGKTLIYVKRIQENLQIIDGNKKNILENGSLNLTKVSKDSAGSYTAEVYNKDGQSSVLLKKSVCVLDPVTKPTMTIKCGTQTPPQVTFTCSYSPKDAQIEIEWLKNEVVIKNVKSGTLQQNSQEVESDSFKCNISNKVSSESSDPVTQTCIKSKFRFLYDIILGLPVWIWIIIGGSVVLLLILIITVSCLLNRRKRRMNLKDEEELRLDWANTEQQHHHHPHNHKHHNPPTDHHHHQQQRQAAGHTGPRPNRSRQQREPRPRLPEPPGSQPQPSPRKPAQGPGHTVNHDEEQPPPLPQPRKKGPM